MKVKILTAAVLLCWTGASMSWGQSQREPLVRRALRVKMEKIEVTSPNRQVKMTLLDNPERLTFTVTRNGNTVIEPSPIRMLLDGIDLSAGIGYRGVEYYQTDEAYAWYGAHHIAVDRSNGARIQLENDLSFVQYILEVRAYDDGVAFRHIIPGSDGASRVADELTTFVIPEGATSWYHDLGGHYEAEYEEKEVSRIQAGEWAGPPVTIEYSGTTGYAVITEAHLVNYSGMALEADGRRGWVVGLGHRQPLNYPFALRYGREEGRRLAQPAAIEGTITTPWRVVLVAGELNTLVNTDIVHNLCPPPDERYFPQGIKTDWIRPGKAVWRYLDGGEETLEEMKEFSRLAGQLGIEHHIIEGFWRRWSEEEIRELVRYSRERGVSLWFWRHSRELRTPAARDTFFQNLHNWGVAGAKIDFLDHEAKDVIDHYEALLETAARYQILINFHGANKPTGRNRTWPNELVREAVRGMESRSLERRARHETILPFTRYLAGPADYTSMHFGERRRDTTWAHQIASVAIFDSPLLTLTAHPRRIVEHPAVEIMKDIPAVWDETMVLPGSKIGELAVFARRTGNTWFLAVMNAEGPRTIQVPLTFLGEGRYNALLAQDDLQDPAAVRVETKNLTSDDTLTIQMPHGGGFIARFVN